MTPEEIVADLDAKNREILRGLNVTPSETIMDMLNQASMHGYKLGAAMSMSMVEGALAVQLAKASK